MAYRYSDSDFIDAVKSSFSIKEVLQKLGLVQSGGAYQIFNLRVAKLNLDISHFTGQGYLKGKTHTWSKKIPLDEVLVKNSNRILGKSFKKRLVDEGILINQCYKCGLKDFWQNEEIVLQVDHINGDHFDHRVDNLRMLCPNCHSQTETFCSKNFSINKQKVRKSEYKKIEKKKCKLCNSILKCSRNVYCKKCYAENRSNINRVRKTKIEWLPIDILLDKLKTISYVQLGKELGVSDNAIRKHIKAHSTQ